MQSVDRVGFKMEFEVDWDLPDESEKTTGLKKIRVVGDLTGFLTVRQDSVDRFVFKEFIETIDAQIYGHQSYSWDSSETINKRYTRPVEYFEDVYTNTGTLISRFPSYAETSLSEFGIEEGFVLLIFGLVAPYEDLFRALHASELYVGKTIYWPTLQDFKNGIDRELYPAIERGYRERGLEVSKEDKGTIETLKTVFQFIDEFGDFRGNISVNGSVILDGHEYIHANGAQEMYASSSSWLNGGGNILLWIWSGSGR